MDKKTRDVLKVVFYSVGIFILTFFMCTIIILFPLESQLKERENACATLGGICVGSCGELNGTHAIHPDFSGIAGGCTSEQVCCVPYDLD